MAVGNSKKLHKHSIPVVVVSVGVLLVTCIGASELGVTKNGSETAVQKVSTTGLFSVHDLIHGAISGNSPTTTHTTGAAADSTPQPAASPLDAANNVGRNLQYNVTISQQ